MEHTPCTHRYFIELAYKGTQFYGWQLQPNVVTVQGEIERVVGILLQSPTRINGAGRTDTGVHASYYMAHFDSERDNLHSDPQFTQKLNLMLPRDIAVFRIFPVATDMHARFNATARTYHYRIATRKNPFTNDLAYHFYRPLNLEHMNEAAGILLEYTDFTSFSKLHGNASSNLCSISEAYWLDEPMKGEICFVITANRFLRNMVRAIVGTMLEIGLGKKSPEDIRQIILSKDRGAAGTSASPQGLYLTHINYPEITSGCVNSFSVPPTDQSLS